MTRPLSFLFCSSLTLVACQQTDETPAAPDPVAETAPVDAEPVLRTYAVPPGRSEEVVRVLRHAFSQGADAPPRGTVNPLDDGRLVVLAPASVHEGIAGMCEDLEAVGSMPAVPTIAISYWLVLADPSGNGSTQGIPSALAPALEAIAAQDGEATFSLLESTRIASLHSAHAKARGLHANIEQVAAVADGAVVADIEIEADRGSGLETRLSLTPGELVVIGHAWRPLDGDRDARLYYIVRAEAG